MARNSLSFQEKSDMKHRGPFRAGLLLGLVALLAATPLFSSCATSGAAKGAGIGAAAGAIVGGIIGNSQDKTAEGAIIGAAVGGAAGAIIGDYMDRQAEELDKDLEGARVERVGEGIKITFTTGLLFDTNSATLQSASQSNLSSLAKTLNKYDDTVIRIDGHTDAQGADDYNLGLSDRRAQSVKSSLVDLAVVPGRMFTFGYGETRPVASNDTSDGRQLNRRVEVAIIANDELRERAMKQAG
jgi:outer membrane protein OmpA-like peptidoglycan-associated protein